MFNFRNFVTGAAVAVASLPSLVLADDTTTPGAPTVSNIVDTSGIQATLVSALSEWIIIGLGVGITLVAVFMGWKWLRRFMGR